LAAYKAQLTPAQAAALKEERRKRLAKRRSFRIKRVSAFKLTYSTPGYHENMLGLEEKENSKCNYI